MSSQDASGAPLDELYRARFGDAASERARVWKILVDRCFQRYVPRDGAVLDIGCGWGEFINAIDARERHAIDLNPDARTHVDAAVELHLQSCAERWPIGDGSLDAAFTSNFLEHLPDKRALTATIDEALRCLKPGAPLVCLGPNIRCLPGAYWDFFDHHIPLSERSLAECLTSAGFAIERSVARFLPYTMSGKRPPPSFAIRAYLALPLAWPLFGRQFLVVARKPAAR